MPLSLSHTPSLSRQSIKFLWLLLPLISVCVCTKAETISSSRHRAIEIRSTTHHTRTHSKRNQTTRMSSPSGVPSTMTGSGGGGGGSSSTTSTPTSTTTPTTSSATSVTTAATKPSATATTASTTSASTSLAPSSRAEDATRRLSAEIDRDQFILLNVGGELINTSRQTLTLDSNSVLGRMFAQDANIGCKRDAGGAVLIDRVRPSNQSRIYRESIANLCLVCHSHTLDGV